MPRFYSRSTLPHSEFEGGTVCITWRLHHSQSGLRPGERDLVMEVVSRAEPAFAELIAAVVMDDHAHVLAHPRPGITARRLVSAWKGASSHRICASPIRHAPLWQRDYFDRWMGSVDQTRRCANYIIQNPRRRWPWIEYYPWIIDRR